ncbi:MAG: hypothetical protein IPM69_07305 [Ignavibacteria bacterium]|nr:hypothetical protein [Ignavibacteria bacterium]
MKNRVILFVIMMSALLLGSNFTTKGQCPTGSSGCPWATPSPDVPVTATVWNASGTKSCTMEIYYCYRICTGFKEMYIRKVNFPNKACLAQMGLTLSSDVFFEQVLKAVIIANPWGTYSGWIHPCSTGLRTVYNIYKASCYQFIQSTFAGSFEACNDEWACWTEYIVCWDYEKIPLELNIVKGSTHTQYTEPCPNTSNWIFDTSDIPCSPICSD